MTTDPTIDPSETTSADAEPLSPSESEPSEQEPTETEEELKEKLAAAETEAKRWKGRVEKANEKKKAKETVTTESLAELEWKLDNKDRIALVQDEYDKILIDGFDGEPVSKKVALELAEKRAKVGTSEKQRARQDEMSVASTNNRNVSGGVDVTEYDKRLGLTAEAKAQLIKENPELARLEKSE